MCDLVMPAGERDHRNKGFRTYIAMLLPSGLKIAGIGMAKGARQLGRSEELV